MTFASRCSGGAAASLCLLVTSCGSSGSPSPSASPAAVGSVTSSVASPTSSASTSAGGQGVAFSCAIKPGAGLLPGATPAPGRILATIADVETAVGFTLSQSVNISEAAGFTACRYGFANGPSLDLTILDDPGRTDTEFAATSTRRLALHDRSCNGCKLATLSALTGLGEHAYTATDDTGSAVIGVVAAGTYFEAESLDLKPARLMRLATLIVGTLTGTQPSLPALPPAG